MSGSPSSRSTSPRTRDTTGRSAATSATWPRWPWSRLTAVASSAARAGTIRWQLGTGWRYWARRRTSDRAGIEPGSGPGPSGAGIPRWLRLRRRLAGLGDANGSGLALVGAGLFGLLVVSTVVIRLAYVAPRRAGPPGAAGLRVLHGRDGGHRRLRGLLLRGPGGVVPGVRDRADRARGDPGVDGLRPVHQLPGEPADRAVAGPAPGARDERPRGRGRVWARWASGWSRVWWPRAGGWWSSRATPRTATSTGRGPSGCRWSSPTPPSARPTPRSTWARHRPWPS